MASIKTGVNSALYETGIKGRKSVTGFTGVKIKENLSIVQIPEDSEIFPEKIVPFRKRNLKKYSPGKNKTIDQKVYEETRFRSFKLERSSLKHFSVIKKFPTLAQADIIDVNSDSQ